jgi:hypothetical protein
MTDTPSAAEPSPVITPPEAAPQPPGYFNQAQLNDLKEGEELAAVAANVRHAANLAKKGFTEERTASLVTVCKLARKKTTATGQAGSGRRVATLNATGKQKILLTDLHGIQGAAKQMKRLLEADGDPATNFDTTLYLIGQRLNPNRATLLQNADTLIALATGAGLPGIDAAELELIQEHLESYRNARDEQGNVNEIASGERAERDGLIKQINALRIALQLAADRAYPYSDDANDAARVAFHLPEDRTFNG